ncbi:hypothetical protein YC2023_034100 [Brassica napus]
MAAIDGAKSQEDCKLKDMKPDLGEEWPHGGQRGGSGWIIIERVAVEVFVRDKEMIVFDMHEIPTRVPPDSQSTCTSMVQYRLEAHRG